MKYVIVACAALALSGCASNKTLYEWGNYQPALINYYKNQDTPTFERKIRESIAKAETNHRVPPGLHAELGYLLYSRGELGVASLEFTREKELFPESAGLMDKLIAGTNGKAQEGQNP